MYKAGYDFGHLSIPDVSVLFTSTFEGEMFTFFYQNNSEFGSVTFFHLSPNFSEVYYTTGEFAF